MKIILSAAEAANVIERFLDKTLRYPQEWNDFIEGRAVEPEVEPFREECYELDPIVHLEDPPDPQGILRLRMMVNELRELELREPIGKRLSEPSE